MNKFFTKLFLVEEIKAFTSRGDSKTSDQALAKERGEGFEVLGIDASSTGLNSFNTFYDAHLNKEHATNVARITNYRQMAVMPEISDVVEDAVNESTQEDDKGNVIDLEIVNEKLFGNENITKILTQEFDQLFFNQLDINTTIWKMFHDYMIDGMLFYERVINISRPKEGVKYIKPLPSESMDFIYNYQTGRIEAFLQYAKLGMKRPMSIDEARKDPNIIVFIPEQIGFIPYRYGKTKNDLFGFLDNCKIAFNQLKLLETSVIIYRLVRAPERFVFKIDVGNMPKDKALQYVNKIKQQMNRKQSYDPNTGVMEGTNNINCIRQNTEIKLLDGRSLPLTEVIKEFNEGKQNWVYSINQQTHEMEPNRIINAAITRKNEQLIRVHLDDGAYFDTTHDHKWIMRDGNEVRADQLKVMDSLMPLYTKRDSLIGTTYNQEYEYVYDLNKGQWVTTHKTGSMPAVVNHKIAKIEYLNERDDTGCVTVENNHNFAVSFELADGTKSCVYVCNSILDNIYVPQSDNRGSDVTTIGGNSAGFTELDDIKYFAKKLYRSLKYPMSRVENSFENSASDNLFRGTGFAEITRDEIKWSRFLERQQNKFCSEFKDLFLLHLEFKGLKQQYSVDKFDINIKMSPPSDYKEQMNQNLLETRFSNFSSISNEESLSKSYLMRTFLHMNDEEMKANIDGFKEDKEMIPKDEEF